jgi:hypothetical protein
MVVEFMAVTNSINPSPHIYRLLLDTSQHQASLQ